MRIDAHVHMMGKECRREKFLENLKEAGMDGAVVFSPSPGNMFGRNGDYRERIERVIEFTKGEEMLIPFFFVDPTEENALKQMQDAVSAGVKGFKIICSHFYPGNEEAMKAYEWIAGQNMPLMFHSGILYDGINVSGKYNRPCEFEPLLGVANLRFSLAHVSWPWTDECIAVYGKFDSYKKREPSGEAASMYLDLTPGTPPSYREGMLTHLMGNNFRVEDTVFWRSDNSVENYDSSYVRKWVERDCEIYRKLGLTEERKNKIYYDNFMAFLNGTGR